MKDHYFLRRVFCAILLACTVVTLSILVIHHFHRGPLYVKGTHYVSVPVTNLLSKPTIEYQKLVAPVVEQDTPHLLAQLLFQEPVIVHHSQNGWSFVTAPTLQEYADGKLKNMQGWITEKDVAPAPSQYQRVGTPLICTAAWTPLYKRSENKPYQFHYHSSCSFGTKLVGMHKDASWWKIKLLNGSIVYVPSGSVTFNGKTKNIPAVRKKVVDYARQCIGMPYCWGGCSAFSATASHLTGFDCSCLVFRIYSACGICIPRFSAAQYHAGKKISPAQLKAGDLIVIARPATTEQEAFFCHVLLYTGNNSFIESWAEPCGSGCFNGQTIREVPVKERFGKELHAMQQGELCKGYLCYGISFL